MERSLSDTIEHMKKVTRVEIVDHREGSKTYGRAFAAKHVEKVLVSVQDDGRTLKVFVCDK